MSQTPCHRQPTGAGLSLGPLPLIRDVEGFDEACREYVVLAQPDSDRLGRIIDYLYCRLPRVIGYRTKGYLDAPAQEEVANLVTDEFADTIEMKQLRREDFDHPFNLVSWLLYRRCIDGIRHRRVEKASLLDLARARHSGPLLSSPGTFYAKAMNLLEEAIRSLGRGPVIILGLEMTGLCDREIARKIGRKVNTTSSLLRRAKKRLKVVLTQWIKGGRG